jgi:hypothetical protein
MVVNKNNQADDTETKIKRQSENEHQFTSNRIILHQPEQNYMIFKQC